MVCEGYSPPEGFDYKDLYKLLEKAGGRSVDLDCSSAWLEGPSKLILPFLACGDLSGYDADQSYPLDTEHSLAPVQPPIAPPYRTAMELEGQAHKTA